MNIDTKTEFNIGDRFIYVLSIINDSKNEFRLGVLEIDKIFIRKICKGVNEVRYEFVFGSSKDKTKNSFMNISAIYFERLINNRVFKELKDLPLEHLHYGNNENYFSEFSNSDDCSCLFVPIKGDEPLYFENSFKMILDHYMREDEHDK